MKDTNLMDLAIVAACILLTLGYCSPAPAEQCDPINLTSCRSDHEDSDRRERERDADRNLDRLQASYEYFLDDRRDPTICQPAEDCRRTLWRRRYPR